MLPSSSHPSRWAVLKWAIAYFFTKRPPDPWQKPPPDPTATERTIIERELDMLAVQVATLKQRRGQRHDATSPHAVS